MVGGFTAFTVVSTMGGSPIVGILAAVVVCTALGVAVERIAYRPLRDASPLAVLITAIGVSYLLQNVALLIFGSNARQFTSVVNLPPLKLAGGELSISSVTIVTILACVVIMAGLMFFINKTKIGQAMLAVSEETRDISGGFILKDGRIEVNCTFDALVRAEREQTVGEVAKLLFPEA